MNEAEHWEEIYSTKSVNQVGWYTPHLETSMKWITRLNLAADDPIIDVGGGASTLIDDLLQLGHRKLTYLDLSESAIQITKERLGKPSSAVTLLCGDITEVELPSKYYCLWHDRAVFHFLIEPEVQQKYRDSILKALKIGGYFLIGAFSLDAPPQCSGLPVQRYTSESLCKTFGKDFVLRRHQNEIHNTPTGVEQEYVYCLFQRTA
ncbi:MAG: class I SAM-dependent methyltransferase [Gammaproteobacteria bacterium]|nr:class I SAM-dependent methyltransferase [Gammaproteobacteria bacterium]MDH3534313.1 class I SAM-dependent methyltransferase [Gammaproteobacteria bacterium]